MLMIGSAGAVSLQYAMPMCGRKRVLSGGVAAVPSALLVAASRVLRNRAILEYGEALKLIAPGEPANGPTKMGTGGIVRHLSTAATAI